MIANSIKTVVLLSTLAALFIGVGFALGGTTGMVIGFLIAMALNFGSFWFSDKIVLKMYHAKEVPKHHRLYKMVKELAQQADLPMPKVYVIKTPTPNAFATGRSPKHSAVAATESLLDMLSEDEARGVMAHELSHIKHRDTLIQTIAVGIASAVGIVAEMMQWALIFGMGGEEDNGVGGLVGTILLLILTPLLATIIQLAISRQREFMADAGAVRLMKSAEPLTSALRKLEAAAQGKPIQNTSRSPTESLFIVNPFTKSGLSKLFSTHPSTQDRIKHMQSVSLN